MKRLIVITVTALLGFSWGCGDDDAKDSPDTASGPDAAEQSDVPADDPGPPDSGPPDTAVPEDVPPDEGQPDVGPDLVEPACEPGHAVRCEDDMVLDLSLHDDKVSTGAITNEMDGEDYVTTVDARAGGFEMASQNPWLYAKVTDSGLERVDIDDLTALTSTDWDLAFKRFGIRLNSGVSGPGCVLGYGFYDTGWAEVTEIPAELLTEEAFYDDQCVIIPEMSGLGSPYYLMSDWWSYPGCVTTTGLVFGIRAAEHDVKLVVESYYETGQETCNTTFVPGTNAGMLTLRWRTLP